MKSIRTIPEYFIELSGKVPGKTYSRTDMIAIFENLPGEETCKHQVDTDSVIRDDRQPKKSQSQGGYRYQFFKFSGE